MSDELMKPCPFCGSNGTLYRVGDGPYTKAGCDAECHGFPETIEKWNTRPIEDALRAELAAMKAAQEWVSVEDRLPDRGQTVYAWIHPHPYIPGCGKEMTYMPMISPDHPWRSTWGMAIYSASDITHWRPLPAPPQEADNG